MTTLAQKIQLASISEFLLCWYRDRIDTKSKKIYMLGVLLSLHLVILQLVNSVGLLDILYLVVMVLVWPIYLLVIVLTTSLGSKYVLSQNSVEYYTAVIIILVLGGIIYQQRNVLNKMTDGWHNKVGVNLFLTSTGLYSVLQISLSIHTDYVFGLKVLLRIMCWTILGYFYLLIISLLLIDPTYLDFISRDLYLSRTLLFFLTMLVITRLAIRYLKNNEILREKVSTDNSTLIEEPDRQENQELVFNSKSMVDEKSVSKFRTLNTGIDVVIDGSNLA